MSSSRPQIRATSHGVCGPQSPAGGCRDAPLSGLQAASACPYLGHAAWVVQKWQTVQGLRGVAKCILDLYRAELGSPPGDRGACQVANSAGSHRSSDRCMLRGGNLNVVSQVKRGAVGSLLLTGTVDATYIQMWSIRSGLGDHTAS